ncbi:MAG: DNA-3-methyladenine glycosylase [Candidatus Brockarchaeota archaeon]|nr:DNA-3-methyladenine glycosylase [Candidatus Brockarchaeota archaeon]
MRMGRILPQDFYARDPALVAMNLLGKVLCRVLRGIILAGVIVETEAYYGETDPASRAYRSRGDIAMMLYGDVGRALVYGVHGKWLFNVVAHEPHGSGGVLIRALEPIRGVEMMKKLRKIDDLLKLTNGPGRLTEAMDINKNLHKKPVYLNSSEITIREGRKEENIARSFRIGVTKDLDIPLRFYVKNSRFVSVRA